MSQIDITIAALTKQARAMGAGEALRRTHYTQAMGGSQWRTLTAHLFEAQNGLCGLTGRDMTQTRAVDPNSMTLHLLVPSSEWGTAWDKADTKASNGKALDPYRFGFVEGNVIVANTMASKMVKSRTASASLLAMGDDNYCHAWTPAMRRAAKPVQVSDTGDIYRELLSRGWDIN